MAKDSRKTQYKFLSDIGRSLLDEIYLNEDGFINGKYLLYESNILIVKSGIHPLESYIIEYDENMEDEGIIINLGQRVGFNIKYDDTGAYPPAVQFYDRCSYTIRHNDYSRIEKIMNMNELEFKNHIEASGFLCNEDIYYDRLNIDSHKYDKNLIEAYYAEKEKSIPDELSYYGEEIVSNVAQVIPVSEQTLNLIKEDLNEDEQDASDTIEILNEPGIYEDLADLDDLDDLEES